MVQTLGGARRSMYDLDEIEEEQQERDRKNKINTEFQGFVKWVRELWEQPHLKDFELEFDIPFREVGFHGVPFKASAFIFPTVKFFNNLQFLEGEVVGWFVTHFWSRRTLFSRNLLFFLTFLVALWPIWMLRWSETYWML